MLILSVIFSYANLHVFMSVTVLVTPVLETLFSSVSTSEAIAVPIVAPKGNMSWKALGYRVTNKKEYQKPHSQYLQH